MTISSIKRQIYEVSDISAQNNKGSGLNIEFEKMGVEGGRETMKVVARIELAQQSNQCIVLRDQHLGVLRARVIRIPILGLR